MYIKTTTVAIALALLVTGTAQADHHLASDIKSANVAGSSALTNYEGMTLYTFDKDTAGKSNCVKKCADFWPPMPAAASSKNEGYFTVIMRSDGSYQWAHKGKALYTWANDSKPGDNSGDGVKGVWHTARP